MYGKRCVGRDEDLKAVERSCEFLRLQEMASLRETRMPWITLSQRTQERNREREKWVGEIGGFMNIKSSFIE